MCGGHGPTNGPAPGRILCVLAAGVVDYRCGGHLRAWDHAVGCWAVRRCDSLAASPDVAPVVDAAPDAVALLDAEAAPHAVAVPVAWPAGAAGWQASVDVTARAAVCPVPWLDARAARVAPSDVPALAAISRAPCPLARVAHRPKPWLPERRGEVPW